MDTSDDESEIVLLGVTPKVSSSPSSPPPLSFSLLTSNHNHRPTKPLIMTVQLLSLSLMVSTQKQFFVFQIGYSLVFFFFFFSLFFIFFFFFFFFQSLTPPFRLRIRRLLNLIPHLPSLLPPIPPTPPWSARRGRGRRDGTFSP